MNRANNRATRMMIAPAAGILVFLAAWELLVEIGNVRPFILRSPSDILDYLGRAPGDFAGASWITAWHALGSLVIALILAILIGAFLAAWPPLERAAQPILILIQVTPFAAYISAVVLWLGSGNPPVLFIVTLVCAPGFTFAAVAGMRSAEPASRELFASVDASRWQVLWRLRLPSAMPSLFVAARYNVGLALIAAYLVEGSNFDNRGLGSIGKTSAALNESDPLWATIFCMAMLGTIALLAIGLLERIVMHWHASQRSVGTGPVRSIG
jgi:NitT/TauT family transport system permease protein